MSNQRMMALAIRKSLLKETTHSNYSSGKSGNCSYASISSGRAVYMNNGDEFQIQLFNPESFTVGCLIYINGNLMSSRKIVLRPGERIWLDRYIDSPDKLKFSTYEVENGDPAVLNAIKNNGNVKVEFYREQEKRPTLNIQPTITYTQPYNHIWDNQVLGMSDITYDAGVSAKTVLGACVDDIAAGDIRTAFCSAQACADSAAKALADNDVQVKACTNTIETGRVEHGGHSSQEFGQAYIDFEYFAYRTEEVKILPMSQKPVRPNELRRKFCPYCGHKVKDGFKYCPSCGQEL